MTARRSIGAWVIGLVTLPLSFLPFWAYTHYDSVGRLLALGVQRSFQPPGFGTISSRDAAFYRHGSLRYHDAVLVLELHGVIDGSPSAGDNPEDTVIDTHRLADDLQMLSASGFDTVTPEQVASFLRGRGRIPANALLITFDGGSADAMLNAPPILAHLHMRATAFVIGGAYERSPVYYASPGSLHHLVRDGWSIEAMAVDGHQTVDAGNGRRLPFMSALRRLPGGVPETIAAFRTRVGEELRAARDTASGIGGTPAIAYAWPFGAYGNDTRTNDPRVLGIDLAEARRTFALAFTLDDQDSLGLTTRETDPMRIPRLRVDPFLTPHQLWSRLQLAIAASAPEVEHAAS